MGERVFAEVAQSVKVFKSESEELRFPPGYFYAGEDLRKERSRTHFSGCSVWGGWAGASGDEEALVIWASVDSM